MADARCGQPAAFRETPIDVCRTIRFLPDDPGTPELREPAQVSTMSPNTCSTMCPVWTHWTG